MTTGEPEPELRQAAPTHSQVALTWRHLYALATERLGSDIDSQRLVVADLGTGSGAIALSIAVEVPDAHVWATDASSDALAVARANLAGIGSPAAVRVRMAQGRWFDALPGAFRGQFDVVVS